MSRWFRWYEGTAEDGKFRVVARNASRNGRNGSNGNVTVATVMGVWAVLLEDASHSENRGVAVRGEPFYCAILDIEEPVLVSILAAMEEVNLISVGHGEITITKWKERQFETDLTDPTNAERQRRFRDKRKNNTTQTERNGTVTADKRPDTDTDTDTDKKEREEDARACAHATPPPEDKFLEFWKAYPRRRGDNSRKAAEVQFREAVRRGADPERIIRAVRAKVGFDEDAPGTEFMPKAENWLRDSRFDDWPTGPPGGRPAYMTAPPGAPSYEEIMGKLRSDGDVGRQSEVRGNATVGKNGAGYCS